MRKLDMIYVHCSATKPSMDIGAKEIRKWHTDKGWPDCGYHYVIRRDGRVETGSPIERAGAHVRGFNRDSIGVCMVGGVDNQNKPDANFTFSQYKSLEMLISHLQDSYGEMTIKGHRDVSAKACPSFDVHSFFASKI